ncbi:hypothetical protein KC19_9G048400 [Ceratodon purpureus]|uniref:Uncharacterized protein n=1 Tax=Ceratodon purpureus TaxID=3225 RepID=A0A8T0GQN3_CERPU|nr:hypothetical protein KC19_9G048400 [Ceratodon purpureus]
MNPHSNQSPDGSSTPANLITPRPTSPSTRKPLSNLSNNSATRFTNCNKRYTQPSFPSLIQIQPTLPPSDKHPPVTALPDSPKIILTLTLNASNDTSITPARTTSNTQAMTRAIAKLQHISH